MFFTFPSSLLMKLLQQETSLYLAVDSRPTAHLPTTQCNPLPFLISLTLWSFNLFSIYMTVLMSKAIWIHFGRFSETVLNPLLKSCCVSFIQDFCSSIKKAITFPWHDMFLMNPCCLLFIVPLSFECLVKCFVVFFSPYFLFPLSTCSVLSQNKVCLELDSLFSELLYFSLLMFEAILTMLCNFSEIIFKGFVFSCALRDVFNLGCLDGCCCFLYFCTMNSKFLLLTFHQPSAFNKDK